MNSQNLYTSHDLAISIKKRAKELNMPMKDVLEDCELGSNTMSALYHGKSIAFDSLARIADYLDCSVDYLLGRTDNPVSHKQSIIIGGKAMAFAARLREIMRIRSQEEKKRNKKGTEEDYGAVYWSKKSDGEVSPGTIASLLDKGTDKQPLIILIAELFNVSVEQLTGEEEITATNIRPYMAKPLGTIENGMRFVHSAANSDDGVYDENTDTDDEEFMAMENEPRGEDVI